MRYFWPKKVTSFLAISPSVCVKPYKLSSTKNKKNKDKTLVNWLGRPAAFKRGFWLLRKWEISPVVNRSKGLTVSPKEEAAEPLSTSAVIRADEEAGRTIRGHGIKTPVAPDPVLRDLSSDYMYSLFCLVKKTRPALSAPWLRDTVESTLRPAGVNTEVR